MPVFSENKLFHVEVTNKVKQKNSLTYLQWHSNILRSIFLQYSYFIFSNAQRNVMVKTITRRNDNNECDDNESVKFIFWYRYLSKSVVPRQSRIHKSCQTAIMELQELLKVSSWMFCRVKNTHVMRVLKITCSDQLYKFHKKTPTTESFISKAATLHPAT